MKILTCVQGSDDWFAARLGVPSASRFKDIVKPLTGDRSASAMPYMYELLAEKITGQKTAFKQTEWMERGNLLEEEARDLYCFITDNTVYEVGFILNDAGTIGVSPDGLMGDSGMLEIKCPKASTMIKYMMEDRLPLVYKPQVMGQLWISEREWCDFVAYHPDMPLFKIRVFRDEAYIKRMCEVMTEFTEQMQEKYEKLLADA